MSASTTPGLVYNADTNNAAQTSIIMTGVLVIPTFGYMLVQTEIIKYTGISGNTI
jgi:predicted membrane-bound dolichyl-phosphate-mannose-protein mannosyltransferase